MRNLIENPTLPYSEFQVISNLFDGGKLQAKQYKGLLHFETGKFYLRISDIGTEPTNIPQGWMLQTLTLQLEQSVKFSNGATTQVNDDAGNSYTLYSQIL